MLCALCLLLGYGHIAPVTDVGRIVTMVYALIGIPLCLVALASLGRLLTRFIKFLWKFVRRLYYTGHCYRIRRAMPLKAMALRKSFESKLDVRSRQESMEEEQKSCWRRFLAAWRRCWTRCWRCCWNGMTCHHGNKSNDVSQAHGHHINHVEPEDDIGSYVSLVDDDAEEFNVPPPLAVFVTVFYIFFGAVMYTIWEDWSFLESFYFIFVSISTIGFGDVLPAHTKYFLASSIYILLGLALVAMVINVIMVVVIDTLNKAKDTMAKAADQLDKAADMAKEAVLDVGQKMGLNISTESLDKVEQADTPSTEKRSFQGSDNEKDTVDSKA